MFLTNQFLKPIFLSSFFLFFFYSFIHLFIYLFFFSFSIVSKSNFLLNLKINLLSSLPPLTQTTYEFYFLVIQWNERNKYSISRKNESFSFLRWVEKKIAMFKKKKNEINRNRSTNSRNKLQIFLVFPISDRWNRSDRAPRSKKFDRE